MNSPWWRNSLLGLAFLSCLGSQAPAMGNHGLLSTVYSPYAETVYAMPTSYLASTAYVYPTSAYIYPSSYVYPTAYTPTSYVVSPTSYVVPTFYPAASYYVPRRFLARPVYSTAYYPTVYSTAYTPTAYYPTVYSPAYLPTTAYYPTVIDTPLVASTSSACCNEAPAISTPAPATPRPSSNSGVNERAPSSVVESVPANEPAYDQRPAPAAPPDSGTPTPPVSPAPERESTTAPPPAAAETMPAPGQAPAPVPAPGSEVNPPVAPSASDFPAQPPTEPAPTTLRRETRKPVAPPTARPPARSAFNTLEGKVVSSDTRQGEEGVRVIVSSRAGNFVDRVATTNAQGQYAVKLPEGDWTVKVAMPSGNVYAVSQITISGGQIVDDSGRNIPSLIITR